MGNAIFSIDPLDVQADGGKKFFHAKANVWESMWLPDGKRIAFSCYTNGRGQIYAMNTDGSDWENLSKNRFCDRSPAWSADGRTLAFASDRDGDREIYRMNADGSDAKRLTRAVGSDTNPVWSPNGKHIAFESSRGLDTDVYVIAADGKNSCSVSNVPGHEQFPTWSPDGKQIAFSATASPMRCLLVANLAKSEKALSESAEAVECRQYRRGTMLKHRKIIPGVNQISHIRWSPDGKRIAAEFEAPQEQDQSGILTVDPDGGNLQHHVHVRSVSPYPSRGMWQGRLYTRHPQPSRYSTGSNTPRWVMRTFTGLAWSSDSQHLAFSSDMDDGAYYVYVLKPDTSEPPRHLDATRSAWPQAIDWR